MKALIKKTIVCSLLAGVLQYGLSTPLVSAAPPDGQQMQNQQDQQQQDQQRRNEQKRKDQQVQQNQQRQGQQNQQRQAQQNQQRQAQQDQQRQAQQNQQRQGQQDQQRQAQQDQQRQAQWNQQRQAQQDQQHQAQWNQQRQNQQFQEKQRQNQRRYDWSKPAYSNDNWRETSRQYTESSPFKWHESRDSMNTRFSSNYPMERIDSNSWNNRFPGLRSYRWHDRNRDNQNSFWYRGVRVRDAVLFYDDSDELVGTGFTYNNEFVFIRDDQAVYQRNDSALLLITLGILLAL